MVAHDRRVPGARTTAGTKLGGSLKCVNPVEAAKQVDAACPGEGLEVPPSCPLLCAVKFMNFYRECLGSGAPRRWLRLARACGPAPCAPLSRSWFGGTNSVC